MSPIRKIVALVPLVACILNGVPQQSLADSKPLPHLRIGVIAPLSGTLAASGDAVQKSIVLADELYDGAQQVEFKIEDDGLNPKNSVTLARKFIDSKVDGIIIFGTPTALAVAPLAEQAQIPLAAISILDKVVADRKFVVRHFVSWQRENQRIIEEVQQRGFKKIAIVATANDASLALRDGFVRDSGTTIVLNQDMPKEDMDFRSVASKIKALQPDAVYHLLFAPQGSAFMKALRAAGCKVPVFAAHNVEDPKEVEASHGTYEGIWFVTGDDRAGGFFFDAYQRRYGGYPAMGGANAFDLAKMMIESVQFRSNVLEYLKNLKGFAGAFGVYDAVPGSSFALSATIKTIRGNRFAGELASR